MPSPFEDDPKFPSWLRSALEAADRRLKSGYAEYGDSYAWLGPEGMLYRLLEKVIRAKRALATGAEMAVIMDTALDLHVLASLLHAWYIGEEETHRLSRVQRREESIGTSGKEA